MSAAGGQEQEEKEGVCNYRLSCGLAGHSKDVRAVTTTPEGYIITASRDTTAKLWVPRTDG